MNNIFIAERKTLKLQNLLYIKLDLSSDDANLVDKEVNKMNTFIHSYGIVAQLLRQKS